MVNTRPSRNFTGEGPRNSRTRRLATCACDEKRGDAASVSRAVQKARHCSSIADAWSGAHIDWRKLFSLHTLTDENGDARVARVTVFVVSLGCAGYMRCILNPVNSRTGPVVGKT